MSDGQTVRRWTVTDEQDGFKVSDGSDGSSQPPVNAKKTEKWSNTGIATPLELLKVSMETERDKNFLTQCVCETEK